MALELFSAHIYPFVRALAALSFLGPALGAAGGVPMRIGFAILFSSFHQSGRDLETAALLGEAALGLCLAAPFIAALEASAALANLIDNGRGQNMSAMLSQNPDNIHPGAESPLKIFQAAFLMISLAPLQVFAAFDLSFSIAPAGMLPAQGIGRCLMSMTGIFWEAMIRAGLLYFPLAVSFMAIDFALGTLAKISGLATLQNELFLIKLIVSIVALGTCGWLWDPSSQAWAALLRNVKSP